MTWPTADEIIHLIWPHVEPERMPLYREQAEAILARFEPFRVDATACRHAIEDASAERDAARAALRTAVSLIGMGIAAAEIGVGAQDIARKLREAMAQFTPEVRIALGEEVGRDDLAYGG